MRSTEDVLIHFSQCEQYEKKLIEAHGPEEVLLTLKRDYYPLNPEVVNKIIFKLESTKHNYEKNTGWKTKKQD